MPGFVLAERDKFGVGTGRQSDLARPHNLETEGKMNDEVYLDAEMKAWEQASDNDYEKFLRDEQQLVFGIPYPLTLETLLDAYEEALDISNTDRRVRQYRAFRARILARDAEKDATTDMLREKIATLEMAIVHQRKEAQDGD